MVKILWYSLFRNLSFLVLNSLFIFCLLYYPMWGFEWDSIIMGFLFVFIVLWPIYIFFWQIIEQIALKYPSLSILLFFVYGWVLLSTWFLEYSHWGLDIIFFVTSLFLLITYIFFPTVFKKVSPYFSFIFWIVTLLFSSIIIAFVAFILLLAFS